MTTWFISRHQGAIEWIKQQNIAIDRFETHLNVADIQQGDKVVGTLPIHLAAEVCAIGADFYFLAVNVKPEQRGTELTATELSQQDCALQPFWVEKKG